MRNAAGSKRRIFCAVCVCLFAQIAVAFPLPLQAAPVVEIEDKELAEARQAAEYVNVFAFDMYKEIAKRNKTSFCFSPYGAYSALLEYYKTIDEMGYDIKKAKYFHKDISRQMDMLTKKLEESAEEETEKERERILRVNEKSWGTYDDPPPRSNLPILNVINKVHYGMRGNGYFLNLSNDTIYEKFSSLMRGVYTALPYYHGGYHFDEHTNLWIIGNYDYFKVSDLEILKILHMHGLYSFTVINSIESAGIYNIERNLSLKKFQDSLKKAKNREVVFFVPNIFKIDHSFNLTAALASLINNGNAASEKPKLLFFHKAQYRIEPLLGGAIGNPVTTEMLDRLYDKKFKPASSFIYLISDEKTGAILFMGRKAD